MPLNKETKPNQFTPIINTSNKPQLNRYEVWTSYVFECSNVGKIFQLIN